MKKIILSLIAIILAFSLMQAENAKKINANKLFSEKASLTYNKNDAMQTIESDSEARILELKEEALDETFGGSFDKLTITDFPVSPVEKAEVVLKKSRAAVSEGTVWLRVTKEGEFKEESINPSFYVGKVKGDNNREVYVYYRKGSLYSVITSSDGYDNYSITPVRKRNELCILTSQSSSAIDGNNPFLDIHLDQFETNTEYEDLLKDMDKPLSEELLQADIAIEATSDFYRLFNDYDEAADYVASVMSLTSQIYQSDVFVSLFVPVVIIHEDIASDPYGGSTQIYERLYEMREVWRDKTFQRTVACLFTDIDYQNSGGSYRVGGVSLSLGTLCDNRKGFCVLGIKGHYNYPTSNYTWDVSVAAHELGHAFGAPHTHSCYFEPHMIDTCITRYKPYESDGCVTTGNPIPRPGTIMSYCHLTNSTHSVQLFFHERECPIIRRNAERASCIRRAIDPTLILLKPSGGDIYFPGQEVKITWASSKIEYVAVKYSLDGGETWDWIETYAEAGDGEIVWEVPDTSAKQAAIKIFDSYNPDVKDSTASFFTIDRPDFVVSQPNEGDKVGYRQFYDIKWMNSYIESVDIDFSSDGGENWNEIATSVTSLSHRWDPPEIESDNCIFRFNTLYENGIDLVFYSDTFSIGKEWAEIISPSEGDTLCSEGEFEVVWESDFVDNVYIQYSTNSGENWRRIKFGFLDGYEGSYDWNVPDDYSSQCLLRITPYSQRDLILDEMENYFIIDSCSSISVLESQTQNELRIIDIAPNPAKNYINVKVNLNTKIFNELKVMLFDSKGAFVKNLDAMKGLKFGINSRQIELPNLAQGEYYFILKSGKISSGKKIQIIK